MNAGKQKAKIDLYTDTRDAAAAGRTTVGETMEDWDQQTLERIVEERRTERDRRKTSIVCKYFLDALEQHKYGFFWICPNGGDDCMYVHALPPGYVLQKREPKGVIKDDEDEGPSLEETIEAERQKVRGGEPVTKESFARWKKAKEDRKLAEAKKQEEEKRQAVQAGRNVLLSGRELLIFKPQLFADDEQALDRTELKAMAPEECVSFRFLFHFSIRLLTTLSICSKQV